jgi:hypothetical protein
LASFSERFWQFYELKIEENFYRRSAQHVAVAAMAPAFAN